MEDKIVYNGWIKVLHRTVKGKTYDKLKDYNAVAVIIVNENKEKLRQMLEAGQLLDVKTLLAYFYLKNTGMV